ncbi:MAG: fatty acid desaturase [Steroidobacteraceae bacterium]
MNIDFLYGILPLTFWGYVLVAFLSVEFTFMAITLYLHRDACHRSLNLHPILRHIFRFWLWAGTTMLTKSWVAVHRKHHARCETADDPHSPQVLGIKKVLLEGAELYGVQARNPETLEKFGRGTPDDWIERNLYTKHQFLGVTLYVIACLVLFGVPGIIILSVQLIATPLMAAGIVNGIGHYWGYRNFECPDAARNISPWGLLIGGEELHNNHHAFPSSAKFSLMPWEFDIGWLYIKVFSALGLAQVIRVAPHPLRQQHRPVDLDTVQAVVINRMHVLRDYSLNVMLPVLRAQIGSLSSQLAQGARKLFVREPAILSEASRRRLSELLASNQELKTVHDFRDRLKLLWGGAHLSNDSMLQYMRDWIAQAEASGIKALADYAAALRGYAMQPARRPA